MTNISPSSAHFGQEVDREGRYFDNIRELAEDELAEPGEEFHAEMTLVPATDYYGAERAVLVRAGISTVGILPEEDLDEWWPLLCAMYDAKEEVEVNARVWTSGDWANNFYASVRLALTSVDNALVSIEDDYVELTSENREAHKTFTNYEEEYWDLRWREAHGMTEAQAQQRGDATRQHLIDNGYLNADGSVPQRTTATSAASSMPEVSHQPTASPSPQTRTPAVPEPDWAALLTPDGTPRANLFQRGYWRAVAGENFPGNRAPRIDYATVGQVEKLVAHYGGDVSEVKKRNSIVLKALWWVLLLLLAIVALIGLVTAPGGLIGTALVLAPFAHHYITRRRLQGPFRKQQ